MVLASNVLGRLLEFQDPSSVILIEKQRQSVRDRPRYEVNVEKSDQALAASQVSSEEVPENQVLDG